MCPPFVVNLPPVPTRERIVLLAIAAVVLVAGIALAASAGGHDESARAGTTTSEPDQPNPAGGSETRTQPQTARLKADLEGIYEVEAHSSGEILAKLEIRPK